MKTALILEGGGMRGMYSAGVLDAFIEKKIKFEYGVGVSAGAAYGVSYISGQYRRNLLICDKFIGDKRYVSKRNMLKEGSLFGLKFVYEDIPNIYLPFDFEGYHNSDTDFYITVTNVETGKTEYHQLGEGDMKYNLLKATCALPLVSPIIRLGDGFYLDGGISDPIPYRKALEDGYEKLVVVLTQHKGYRKTKQSMLKLIKFWYRKYPEVYELLAKRHNIYNSQIDELEKLEEEGRCIILRPDNPVEIKRIETDKEKLKKLYFTGEADGLKYADKVKSFLKE